MHPFVRILSLIVFAANLHWMSWRLLLVVGAVMTVAAFYSGTSHFIRLLRRARWLLLSMLVIYAYATPGEYVGALPEWFAPTYEGLREGCVQMLRLILMLGAISLLLATTDRSRLMSGLYWLLQPLRLFNIEPSRFAARLWLTLHYVETMPKGVFHLLRQQGWRLESVLRYEAEAPETVMLSFPAIRGLDWVCIAGLILFMVALAAGWVR